MKKLINRLMVIAFIVASMATIVSCKDYNDVADLNGKLSDQATLIEALTQQVNLLQQAHDACTCKADIAELNEKMAAAQSAIDKAKEDIANNASDIAAILEDIKNIKIAAAELTTTVNANSERLTELENNMALIQENYVKISDIAGWGEKLEEAYNNAAEALATVKNNVVLTEDLAGKVKEDSLLADANYKTALELIRKAEEIANSKIGAAELDAKLGELRSAFETADQELKEEIAALADRVTANELSIQKILSALNKQVTGITVNGTNCPLLGYFAAPVGDFRSTVLCAFYGSATTDVPFPTAAPRYYTDQENVGLTASDLAITNPTIFTQPAGTFISKGGQEGNAGTVYMTLNPIETDLEGKTFTLVNSQGVPSAMSLDAVDASTETLTFGMGRSTTSANGFYEAKATLQAADIESVKAKIDMNDLKTAIKDVLNEKSAVSFKNLAEVVATNMNGVLDANALKTTWTDDDNVSHSVLSQYSIAATAVKPLAYSFMRGSNYKLPVITPIDDFNFKIDGVEIGQLGQLDVNQVVHVEFDVPINITVPVKLAVSIEGKDGWAEGDITVTGNQHVSTDMTIAQIGQLVDKFNEVNDMLGNLQSQIDSMINSINSQLSSVNSYIAKINDYINKINSMSNHLSSIINSVNARLQICMLYETANGFAQMSNSMLAPTTLNSTGGYELVMYPTSYTAELLAPAYKKWVAVTNVYSSDYTKSAQVDGGSLKDALNFANSANNINTVVDGDVRAMKFQSGEAYKGMIYEIAYSGMDYNGKVSTRKFYVKVK